MARRPRRRGAAKASSADQTKGQLGVLALSLSALCLILTVMFFLSTDGMVLGMSIGNNTDTWGWMLALVSAFLAVTGLSLAVTMRK